MASEMVMEIFMNVYQKDHEKKTLEEALSRARMNGGESRRNAERLNGEYVDRGGRNESPDFVLHIDGKTKKEKDRYVGVEHFRVDQLFELNIKSGHMDSVPLIGQARMKKARNEQWYTPDGDITKKSLQTLAINIAKHQQADETSYPLSFAEALRVVLFKHLNKVENYQDNINLLPRAQNHNCQLAFLLEVHTNFHRLILNNGISARRVLPGELLLWPSVFDSLAEASKSIDYLILATYSSIGNTIENAYVLKCSNFQQSLKRSGLYSVSHYGENTFFNSCPESNLTVDFAPKAGGYDVLFGGDSIKMMPEAVLSECLRCLPKALRDKRDGRPFTSTISMQTLIDIFGDYLTTKKSSITYNDIMECRARMSSEEFELRCASFEKRFFDK